MRTRRPRPAPSARSAFAGFRSPPEVIVLAVRWYLRYGLSYRDVEELLVERGVEVDHVTAYGGCCGSRRCWPSLPGPAAMPSATAGRSRRPTKVAGQWRYVSRAIDQLSQVVDVFVSARRDADAAERFFQQAMGATSVRPVEVTTDRAPVCPAVLEALLPAAWHRTEQYANNGIECDHGRLKERLGPMRGLKEDRSAKVIIAGQAFVQTFGAGITSWRLRSWRLEG
jgi:transposase-like protein